MHIIHLWAAVMGCNIFEKESSIIGSVRGVFLNTLSSFDNGNLAALNPGSFSTKLRKYV